MTLLMVAEVGAHLLPQRTARASLAHVDVRRAAGVEAECEHWLGYTTLEKLSHGIVATRSKAKRDRK